MGGRGGRQGRGQERRIAGAWLGFRWGFGTGATDIYSNNYGNTMCVYVVCVCVHSYAPGGVTYGEMFYQNEYEMSCYNLDEADVAGQRARFDLYDK